MPCISSDTPTIQGIKLVTTDVLPDRMRSIFHYPLFNAIQSKCFHTAYETKSNLVLVAPTASGKTIVLELAICQLSLHAPVHEFKIVYVAPTKSLCSERFRDWKSKFSNIGLHCIELTGDTDQQGQTLAIKTADIIITTPEKWDSITRRWKDHQKLMALVKLLLIDEVHLLKEDRGAVLESLVSRMKTMGNGIRIVALSATVPNPEDIAAWLGKTADEQGTPAELEVFDESFRPTKLEKHVYGYKSNGSNNFAFDKTLDKMLPEVISKHSLGKPILVFCPTRASVNSTAGLLSDWWRKDQKCWARCSKPAKLEDQVLRECFPFGVGLHHGGLSAGDRLEVERCFLAGQLSVICCTSTLAVGVNLPCHLVIVKNTVYWDGTTQTQTEYSELDMIQMLGRAGRPQFGQRAIAVVMTRQERVAHYENLMDGKQTLESKLHVNLIEHINAEIGLGTIDSTEAAKKWLDGTFFATRFRKNPGHYNVSNVEGDICDRNIALLQSTELVTGHSGTLKLTELGAAMARYCVQFDTMKIFLALPNRPRLSEILSAIAQATEFRSIGFRASEKALYKAINESPTIKFPIKVNLALVAHKVSLIIQASLGGVDVKNNEQFRRQRQQYFCDETVVFQHAQRLQKAIVDCQLYRGEADGMRNALDLQRSLSSKCWEGSPLQMAQIEGIGPVTVRKLISAGVGSLEELAATQGQRIDMILSRNPPFGAELIQKLESFPRLWVTLRIMQPTLPARAMPTVLVPVRAQIGFLNNKPQATFQRRPIYVCFLAETSDGRVVHYHRTSGQKLVNGEEIKFTAAMTHHQQVINCTVSCEDFVGTVQRATIDPELDAASFVHNEGAADIDTEGPRQSSRGEDVMPTDRAGSRNSPTQKATQAGSERGGEQLKPSEYTGSRGARNDLSSKAPAIAASTARLARSRPQRLSSGKWACNHTCKDKSRCRHYCCNEGLDKPPLSVRKRKTGEQPVQSFEPTPKIFQPQKPVARPAAPQTNHTSEDVIEIEDDYSDEASGVVSKRPKLNFGSSLLLSSPSDNHSGEIEEIDLSCPSKSNGGLDKEEHVLQSVEKGHPKAASVMHEKCQRIQQEDDPYDDDVFDNDLDNDEFDALVNRSYLDQKYDSSADDLGLLRPLSAHDMSGSDAEDVV